MSTHWRIGLLGACVAGLLIAGCGGQSPKLVPVEGRVVYEDGTPVFPGSIWFVPDEPQAPAPAAPDIAHVPTEGSSSILDETGSFRLRTYPHGDGAMVGRYKATLSLGPGSSRELSRYAGPTTTPLHYDVPESGLEELVIKLDARPAPPGTSGPPNARGYSNRPG